MGSNELKFRSALLAFIVSWALASCLVEGNLELVITNARLPTPSYDVRAVYDGQDSIYLIGDRREGGGSTGVVLRYYLDSDRVTSFETFTPVFGGSAAMTNSEDILYYGGFASTTYVDRIHSYSTKHGNYSVVATLPVRMGYSTVAWDSVNQTAYLIGGFTGASGVDSVIRHNTKTNEVTRIGTLPVPIYGATAVWVNDGHNGVIYNFGGSDASTTHNQKILQLDPIRGNTTTLPVSLPRALDAGCSVYLPNQQQAYVFGDSPLQRFDTTTHNTEQLQVEGWPLELRRAGCVYVPRLGRMYILGGYGSYAGEAVGARDQISYVELDLPETTETPSTESSICPPNGVINLPYPGNCTLYIRCFHGGPQILSCDPLRFDTRDLICKRDAFCDQEDLPTTVAPTTMDPEPGLCPPIGYEVFPHESNCSKYYECNDGVAYESDCAGSTYFDIHHEIRRCNFAELAVCNAECPVIGNEFQAIRAGGCKWYKVCIEGHSINLKCGDGTVYDPEPQRCVPEVEYSCPYMSRAV